MVVLHTEVAVRYFIILRWPFSDLDLLLVLLLHYNVGVELPRRVEAQHVVDLDWLLIFLRLRVGLETAGAPLEGLVCRGPCVLRLVHRPDVSLLNKLISDY